MSKIRLYDTLRRRKRPFVPGEPGVITMYVCGPTVYNRAHIGNARPAVVFDVLARLLRYTYPRRELRYARNVTDVDDKIIDAARREDTIPSVITRRFERYYDQDMAYLGVEKPPLTPRATKNIRAMKEMIASLIASNHAYVADGHVLFSVSSDSKYGCLGRQNRDEMIAGARVEVASYKRDPADFVLWKPSAPDTIGWPSRWGRGRPGWHIECSAMIAAHLGKTIDIHGGGRDLIVPHHENEIAQSRCANHAPLARYWIHNGFLSMGTEKMSKSLGNVITVHDLLIEGHRGSHLRHALLTAHYRQPLIWTESLIAQSQRTVDRWRGKWERRAVSKAPEESARPHPSVVEALADDLNTPVALSALGRLAAVENWPSFVASAKLLGINFKERPANFAVKERRRIDRLVERRTDAKKQRDWTEADRIRDDLAAEGIVLEDGPAGTSWRRA
ncbi:cysteine--tRNA ligase [Sphingosinicella sp.]|uniref:cysteine--tRNA ligase n=1 Tax=Sphingosinicella sp. TaxID=1917971 RepID=UPI00403827CA